MNQYVSRLTFEERGVLRLWTSDKDVSNISYCCNPRIATGWPHESTFGGSRRGAAALLLGG